jgi:mannosyltransferase OCH1-like enzyme
MNFPKNIFQTWKTKEVPDIWKKGQQSIIDKNPNWNYVLLTDADNDKIVKENFPDFYQTYISFKYPIQRADAIRYCVLYLYGGIYLDLDYICNKSFDTITLNADVGLIKSNNTPGIFTNSFLVSKRFSSFWLKALEEMKKELPWYKKLLKHTEIMYSTGPLMINNLAKTNTVENLKDIQTPCNVCNIKSCEYSNNYYITPIDGSSWHSWDSTFLNFLLCNKNFILFILIVVILYSKLR